MPKFARKKVVAHGKYTDDTTKSDWTDRHNNAESVFLSARLQEISGGQF
tara:strand:- start:12 stop:158 length:147 start_codon:yes stop_codon:yes gene_type:complete